MKGMAFMVGMWSLVAMLNGFSGDLLRFTNGDQLHGSFQGINPGPQILWKRDDVTGEVEFQSTMLRHVVFNGGKAAHSLASYSHVACVNGDRLPGKLLGLDAETVTLETPYAGLLKIPRKDIAMMAPSPLGGRIYYHGPFTENDWQFAHPGFPEGFPAAPHKQEDAAAEVEDAVPDCWHFSGASWIWAKKSSGTALIRRDSMPDRAVLRFDVEWKNRLSLAVALHADLKPSEVLKEDVKKGNAPARVIPGDSSILPQLFGNSYVMHIFSSHIMLYRTRVAGQGVAGLDRMQVNSNNLRLGESGKATLEIRSNRQAGSISLFINGDFAAQWNDKAGLEDFPREVDGHLGLGFVVQAENCSVRLSDIIVAEWNGMPDSARSLQVDEQDVVLLVNGTDRFSGNVKSLIDGDVRFEGKFGEFVFPLEEVAEVRFAKNRMAAVPEQAAGESIVRFSPIGHLSGKVVSSDRESLRLKTGMLGEIFCKLDAAVMLDFQPSNDPIDDWNSQF